MPDRIAELEAHLGAVLGTNPVEYCGWGDERMCHHCGEYWAETCGPDFTEDPVQPHATDCPYAAAKAYMEASKPPEARIDATGHQEVQVVISQESAWGLLLACEMYLEAHKGGHFAPDEHTARIAIKAAIKKARRDLE